jgi:putative transposase
MLNDKIQEYKKSKTMLKNTPAMYKKTYSFLKEVDSLALANVQLHLEKAYKNFFRDPKVGFPRFKSKHHSKNSYTTNVVNGNILVEGNRIRLPKLK